MPASTDPTSAEQQEEELLAVVLGNQSPLHFATYTAVSYTDAAAQARRAYRDDQAREDEPGTFTD